MHDKIKEDAAKASSNEVIAHSIAERVLAHMSNGKTQDQVMKDLG
jgi:cytochrome c-type biogenesis protein CcmH/NrfF